MPAEKLIVSWDEISSPKVDERLKLLDSAAAAVQGPPTPPPQALVAAKRGSLLYNTIVYMSFFGLLGGLLGWGLGEGLNFRGSAREEARQALNDRAQIVDAIAIGAYTKEQGISAL